MQNFLDLNPKEQAEIIQSASYQLGKTPEILPGPILKCNLERGVYS